jgi:LCP family protein required for cell wall assembly
MRTTLKRGIGRANGLNGNGHAAVPPLLGPITRYRQPEPPDRSLGRLVLRGFGWFVLALAVVVSGVAGGVYLYGHETLTVLKIKGHTGVVASKQLAYTQPGQPAIALIAGYDHRSGTGTNSYAGSNSDTLMLVRADPVNDTLSLLSFPRDLSVNIYCSGDTVDTQSRINSAWALCGNNGHAAVLDTVEHLTNLKINYLITLDFHAFKQIVNRLHGVYMNVDRRYYNPVGTGWSAINLHPGYQKLDGGQALSYVRFRHFDSDIYRTGRQQLFLDALKSRMRTELSLSNFELVLKLIGALKGNLSYAKAGGGTVGFNEIRSYLGLSYHLPPGHLFRDSIPIDQLQSVVIGGADELTAPQSAIDGAVSAFLHPNISAGKQVSAQTGSAKPHHAKKKTAGLPHKDISVLVLNAGTVPGQASNTTYLLTRHGYATKTLPAAVPANAPGLRSDTVVYYDPVQPRAKEAAQELKPLFGSHTRVAQMTSSIAAFAQQAHNPLTVVAVGRAFSGKLTLPHRLKPLPKTPPQVSDGLSVTAAAIRAENGPAHFPLMVPHEIAQYAQLSSEEGVRLFKPLHAKQELALTFLMPNGIQYWQIEETNWNSAPILANPTYHFVYRGRHFDVYTTGGAIQMVVLRMPKTSYWVVNTILNQLSNSTMIAIAKSLQPLQHG